MNIHSASDLANLKYPGGLCMKENDFNQVLLELALSTGRGHGGSDFNMTRLLDNTIPLYIHELGCTGAYVWQTTAEGLQVVCSRGIVEPLGFSLSETAGKLSRQLNESVSFEGFRVFKETLVYHVFTLKSFGFMILVRETQLDSDLLDRLLPVVDLLAQACQTFQEVSRSRKEEEKWHQECGHLHSIIDNLPDSLKSQYPDAQYIMPGKAEAAGSANMAKARFLANMSHEIRTPLNAITGMIRILRDTRLNEQQMKLLDNLDTASDNLIAIVNDILDFSTIDSGQLELKNMDFDINELVRKVYDANEYQAENKNIKLLYSVDPAIPEFLNGDTLRLQQILNNLMSNAIKFTQVGKVELHCKLTGTENGKNQILFVVEDTGIGISPENLEKIFYSFQQEDDSITRTHSGTGLGLAISKKLVELMGGALIAESTKNMGSKFYFTINMEKGQPFKSVREQRPVNSDASSLKGIRVLLAEDNKFNQLIVEAILEKWGATSRIAEDGQQAVDILASEKFDLILMDIQMPVMDGITAATIIRNKLKLQTPILALTASVVKGVIEPFEKAGMQGYISKPFEEDEFFTTIKSVLALSKEENTENPEPVEQIQLSDVSRLSMMVGNDARRLNMMIEKFLEVTPEYVRELTDAASNHDLDGISRTSHKIKSSIDLVSNDTMRSLIKTIHDISQNGQDDSELYELVQKFRRYFSLLSEQLKKQS